MHPLAWWVWAVGLGTAATRTTNPLLLLLIAAVAGYVVAARGTSAPWARCYGGFLRLGIVVLVIRLVITVLFGQPVPGHVLLTLPQAPLPDWAAGVRIGGPVTVEALVRATYDGLRLAVLLGCVGAANALTSPYRLLRCLPGVLYEAGVAVSVAMTFAPQTIVSVGQIRNARRLRGRPTGGVAGLRGLAVPVLEAALRRSLDLAASMDARGFGRRQSGSTARVVATALTLAGLLGAAVGTYGLLDAGGPAILGLPAFLAGAALLAGGLAAGSRRTGRTRYRPDHWNGRAWLVAATGIAVVAAFVVEDALGGHALHPFTNPIEAPVLPLLPLAAVLAGLLPAVVAPRSVTA